MTFWRYTAKNLVIGLGYAVVLGGVGGIHVQDGPVRFGLTVIGCLMLARLEQELR